MNDGFFLDIILFAMVAAFLVLRLRHVLGRRTGNQGPRDTAAKRQPESDNEGNVIELADRTAAADEIRNAVSAVLEDGHRTGDIVLEGEDRPTVGCIAMAELVLAKLGAS